MNKVEFDVSTLFIIASRRSCAGSRSYFALCRPLFSRFYQIIARTFCCSAEIRTFVTANGIFTHSMIPTTIEDNIFDFEAFEEDAYVLMVAETSWRGIADELQELHNLKGAQFINQLKQIVYYGDFHPIEGESDIFSAISEQSEDFDNLINAARKAVEHGYRVYMLPNPKGIRTADFIFERKGIYKMFDLKTITGKKIISVTRDLTLSSEYYNIFMKRYIR